MGAFDDLVPSGKGGAFDDLIPDEPGFLSTLKQHTQGAMDDVGKAIQKGASMLPGMGGQLAAQISPETYSGAFAAGADIIGAIPGIGAGVIAGTGVAAAHGDPVGGLEVAKEVMSKSTPTALAGIDMSKNPAYAAGMKPFEVLTHGIEQAAKVPGKFGKALYGLEDTSKVDAATELAILAGTFGLGSKGRKTASPYDGLRKTHSELKGKTDAEIVDWLEAKKDAPPPERIQGELERIQGELFDVTPPEGQYGTRDPLLSLREEAAGELRSIEESAAHNREALSGGQKELFPERTGLEVVDNGLERPNKVVSDPLTPEGITNPKEYEHGFGSTRVVSEDRAPLRIEEPGERPSTIPYSNTIFDYVYSRFPELTERLQRDTVAQRLMATVQQLTDHMNETRSMAGRELIKGVEVKRGTTELMPGAEVPGKPDIVNSKRAQAEMDRLKAEYDTSAQRLDVTIQQLSNRLKSRARALGIDIADNAKFSDWINDRLNSSGPAGGLGKDVTGKPYVEGSASANIKKSVAWGRKQRGVIDPDLLTFGVSALIRKLGDSGVLEKFKGTYNPAVLMKAIHEVTSKPASKLVWLSPDQFHDLAKVRRGRLEFDIIASQKHDSIKSGLRTPSGLHDMPMLVVDKIGNDYKVVGHEGRHRMDVFKEQGMDKIPVLVRIEKAWSGGKGDYLGERLGQAQGWPEWVISENGKGMEFPKPMDLGPLGQTKIGGSQRGAIGWKSETPFEKFEKSLPAPYKPMAAKLWRDLEAKKEQKSFAVNDKQVATGEVLKDVTGINNNYTPIISPFKEVKDYILGGDDIKGTKIGQLLVSGGKMYAQQTKNRAIRYATDIINASKKAQEVATYNKLFADGGIISSWEKLSRNEQAALWDVVKRFKMKEWLDDTGLRREGMNDKQIAAYQAGRKHLEQTINDINAERVAHGEKEITPMPGYFPSRWKGNFYFDVMKRHSDGRLELVRIETGNWKGIGGKGGLEGTRQKFLLEHGHEFEVGPIQERPRYGDLKETYTLFDNLLDTVGRDHPDRVKLDAIFEQYSAEMADRTRMFRRHFDINSGVEGYRGDSVAKSSYENAKDALYSLEGYMRDAHNYIETKRAAREVNGLLYDKEVAAKMPNASAYIRDYWDFSNGVEPGMAKFIDYVPEQLARSLGFSRYTPKHLVQEMKKNMMIFFLGFNRPVFLLSQAVQPIQFMSPYLLRMKADLGVKGFDTMIAETQTKAYWDVVNLLLGTDKMSALGKESSKYMIDNRIVDTHFLDEIKNSGTRVKNDLTKMVTGQTALMMTEKYARATAYFNFVHFLEKSGLKGETLFKTAADATDIAMTNYVTHERAMIYKHFGIVGDLASPLTTFKHNYFSQLYLYGKEALKNPSAAYAKPLLAFLMTQYLVGGYMGLPGRQEADWIIDTARAHGLVPPTTKNITQMLAATTAKWQNGKDAVRYGAFAGATGMDVSPTFAAASLIPDNGVKQLFPVPSKVAEIAGNVANVGAAELGRLGGGPGSTSVDRARLLKSVLPPAAKIIGEMVSQNKQTGMIPNPNDHMTGDVRRGPPSITDKNWVASGLGTNSIAESEQRQAAWQSKLQEEAIKSRKSDLIAKAKDLQTSGMPWTKQAQEYMSLGGTMNEMVNAIKQNQMDQQQTREQRQKGAPKNVNQAQKYQRFEEYGVTK